MSTSKEPKPNWEALAANAIEGRWTCCAGSAPELALVESSELHQGAHDAEGRIGPVLSFLVVTCDACKRVELFNASALGLVRSKRPF